MKKQIGFIGSGNMASAIAGGIVSAGYFAADEIIMSDKSEKQLSAIGEKYGVNTTLSNIEVAQNSEIIVLAVKPQFLAAVLEEIKTHVPSDVIIVSIAAGFSLADLEVALANDKLAIVRTMPNTPALVLQGATAICPNKNVSAAQLERVVDIFKVVGVAEVIEERLIHAFTAVAGSSPAYVYMMIEAMADGAVLEGIPRDMAYRMAAQAVLGSAKMVLDTGRHPGDLKDMVCSPGGVTIAAVSALEQDGFRGTVINAMEVCADKSRNF